MALCLGEISCARPLASPAGPANDAPGGGGALLRVGTSGDYPPFSDAPRPEATSDRDETTHRWAGLDRYPTRSSAARPREAGGADELGGEPGAAVPAGFDPELARAFARDTGRRIEWVPFRWPELSDDLAAKRFDVAMSGVTVRPERSRIGRYSLPVVGSGAVLLLAPETTATSVDEIDREPMRIAVNRGGHLERVARTRFVRAQIIAIQTNEGVIAALAADDENRIDAVVTDTLEAPKWRARVPGSRVLGPFTSDRKAWLVRSDAPGLARELDGWLLERERDGSLGAARSRHLGEGNEARTALPLPAVLAALDERLGLMPAVAEAKRASGAAIEDRARERRVIDAGLAAAHAECRALSEDAAVDCRRLESGVRALLRASIDAAKAIQRRVLAAPAQVARGDRPPTLAEIRPALLRIGERIAWLAVRLPDARRREGPSPSAAAHAALRARIARELRRHDLDPKRIEAFAAAIEELASAPRGAADGGSATGSQGGA